MGHGTTPLVQKAQSIFTDLGYTVSAEDGEFRAERKWRVVRVTAGEPEETPTSGELRCFVLWQEQVARLRRTLREINPEYDWAIIGVDEDEGGYEVVRGEPGSALPKQAP